MQPWHCGDLIIGKYMLVVLQSSSSIPLFLLFLPNILSPLFSLLYSTLPGDGLGLPGSEFGLIASSNGGLGMLFGSLSPFCFDLNLAVLRA